MKKTIRVYLYATANDSYVELWKVVNQDDFIARYVFGAKTWCYVSDPLGYCELDYQMSDDIDVIVCTPEGKELFATRNGDGTSQFPTMEAAIKKEFAAYRKEHPEIIPCDQEGYQRFKRWLLSFKDPEKYGIHAKGYEDNWVYSDAEKTKETTIKEWDYLGYTCSLEAVSYRHKFCGKEWTVMASRDKTIGYIFDDSQMGPMYSESEARDIIMDSLRVHFGDARAVSVPVHICGDNYAQRNIRMYEATNILLEGNYRREFVKAAAEKEKIKSNFFREGISGIDDIRAKYPECSCDYHFIL